MPLASESDGVYYNNHAPVFHRGDLPSLIEAARAVELQMPIDDRLRRLLRPGGTAGGARPKAVIEDDGIAWIAKFPPKAMMSTSAQSSMLRYAWLACAVSRRRSRAICNWGAVKPSW